MYSSKMYSSGGTVRSHASSYVTLASRGSLHTLKSVTPSEIILVPVKRTELDRKIQVVKEFKPGMAISNFSIKFEKEDGVYRPGETISGQVIMDVWAPIEIRFVEFVIRGKATLRVFADNSKFKDQPQTETYVDKKIMLITPRNGSPTTILDPGKYVSDFKYKLPEHSSPTVPQYDMGKGYVFDITYFAQANVCDMVRGRKVQKLEQLARVVKSVKRVFTVASHVDWRTLPGATEPVSNVDQVVLNCAALADEPTSVLVSLTQAVYPIGDKIRVKTEVFTDDRKHIKIVNLDLLQEIVLANGKKFDTTLIQAWDDGKRITTLDTSQNEQMFTTGFAIPIPMNVMPSYLPHCKLLTLNYSVRVTIKFKGLRGKLIVTLPLVIAPEGEPLKSSENTSNIPIFNKPTMMQFPYFGKTPNRESQRSNDSRQSGLSKGSNRNGHVKSNGDLHEQKGSQNQVLSEYKACGRCCLCSCFGIGIQ